MGFSPGNVHTKTLACVLACKNYNPPAPQKISSFHYCPHKAGRSFKENSSPYGSLDVHVQFEHDEKGKKITLKTSNMSIKAVNRHGRGRGGAAWEQFSVNDDGDVLYDPARLPSRRKKRGD